MPDTPPIRFPIPTPPPPGHSIDVAPGIAWLRLALPFRLDHVNVYLVEDGPGTAIIDTGIGDQPTQAVWETLLAGPLRHRPVTRIVATHFHPDHVGMAGWLCGRTGAPLLMSQSEYLTSRILHRDPAALHAEHYRRFYRDHGLDADTTEKLLEGGHRYLGMVTDLPPTFHRLIPGEPLRLGHRVFDVLTGGGHAPEQVMLHCPADGLLLCADQVLTRISPNISVQSMDPAGNPLGIYLRSLDALRTTIPPGTLALPGHDLPFTGLHARIGELKQHHEARCTAILDACRHDRLTAAELIPVVFRRPIDDPHQMGFAFSEALAHINLLCHQGRLTSTAGRYASA